MARWAVLCGAGGLLMLACFGAARAGEPKSPLDFKVSTITGQEADLAKYRGKVVLIVNVASYCGNTRQYEPLEALWQKYKSQGLVVLGFPANEFGEQEPGSNQEIQKFCADNYKVDFPMFSKIVAKGPGIAPLYDFLTNPATNPKFAGPISWNFEKFLIGRDGQVVARFEPDASPDSPEVVREIEAQLTKKAP
jgi:glutathione peroxidase